MATGLRGRKRLFGGRMCERANSRDLPARVVVHRCARAEQPLQRLRRWRGAKSHGNPIGLRGIARLVQLQAGQPSAGRRADVDRTVAGHFAAVRRVHAYFVGAHAPQVRDLFRRRHGDEHPQSGSKDVFAEHGIGVQPEFGAAQQPEAEVQHLERQAVARRFLVLTHETAPLQDSQQPMNCRCGQLQRPGKLAYAQASLNTGERFTHVERFLE